MAKKIKKFKLFESPNHVYDKKNGIYIGCFEDFTENIKDITFFYYDNQFVTGTNAHVTDFQIKIPEVYNSIKWKDIYS